MTCARRAWAVVRRYPRTLAGLLGFVAAVTVSALVPVLAPLMFAGGVTTAGAAVLVEVSTHARP